MLNTKEVNVLIEKKKQTYVGGHQSWYIPQSTLQSLQISSSLLSLNNFINAIISFNVSLKEIIRIIPNINNIRFNITITDFIMKVF